MDVLNRLLKPISSLYGGLSRLEKTFFEWFPFLRFSPRAKVICIGNLTVGGTGKTPVLMEILRALYSRNADEKVAVLTRGYRSPWERGFYLLSGVGPHPKTLTDETILVHSRFPDTPILVGKNRAHSAFMAEKLCGPSFLLLDDGFQYRRLRKDVNCVLWDATTDVSAAQLLPLGRLREPLERLKEASCVFLTRSELLSAQERTRMEEALRALVGKIPIVPLATTIAGIIDGEGNVCELRDPVLAFSAIGNPASFEKQLEQAGIRVGGTRRFRDHHSYTAAEIQQLALEADSSKLTLICTEKDRVKIPKDLLQQNRIHSLLIGMKPLSGQSWQTILDTFLPG